ncbi:adenylate cyclase type 3-like [Malurus melanocephalus]|uniref:adenylate cyclase type 3-like n=1 Tax=Malurus melanocephalus TaxID=175006 RepID=UPI0025487530|nr:adenylate cyclase type 3-like [Malurus melanocephalus]
MAMSLCPCVPVCLTDCPLSPCPQLGCQHSGSVAVATNGTWGVARGGACAEQPRYYGVLALLALVATVMLVQVSHMVKLTLMLLVTVATGAVTFTAWEPLLDQYDRRRGQHGQSVLVPSKYSMTAMTVTVMLSFYYFSRHVEKLARTQFLWKMEVHEQKERVSEMRRWNEALVANMLPEHVARHFLGSKKRDEELYSQVYDEIGIISRAHSQFRRNAPRHSRLDPLLDEPRFRCITKIKTIGSTYMAASGVTPDTDTFGAKVVEETQQILKDFGFRFVRRGAVFVKGKGELLTFFLKGREKPGPAVPLPHQVLENS